MYRFLRADWSPVASDVARVIATRPVSVTWTEQVLAHELGEDPIVVRDALEELHLAGAVAPAKDRPGWRRAV